VPLSIEIFKPYLISMLHIKIGYFSAPPTQQYNTQHNTTAGY